MYCKCHKANFKSGGSYIDSPDWMKQKKATINSKNAGDICFQCAISVALNSEEIELHPDRISNIKPFINKYNWKRINHPSKIDYWETFENNNLTIALNILYIKEKQIYPTDISKHSTTREKQMILLMIPNKKKEGLEAKSERRWHHLSVKKQKNKK